MMAVPAGCKYTPKEEVLVGNVLRKRVRGEPLDRAAADCIREADVYGDDPAQLTALYAPTNRGPHEWFFFSRCRVKGERRARCGGRDDRQEARRGNGVRRGRRERTVRDAGGAEIGKWRSTQAVRDVIQIDASGRAVRIGYHQNFEFRDRKRQKSDWLMEEYGILPSPSSGGAEASSRDGMELVICKIYKTPAARRADANKQAAAPAATLPPRASPQPRPSQPEPPQRPPPPWSALPPLLPASWPELSPPKLPQTSWPELSLLPKLPQTCWPESPLPPKLPQTSWPELPLPKLPQTSWPEQLLPPPPESGTLSWPPQRELTVPPPISAQLDAPWRNRMTAAGNIPTSFRTLDRDWPPDFPHAAGVVYSELYQAVAPFVSSPVVSERWAVAEIGPHTNLICNHPATYVGSDQMQTTSQIPQSTPVDISDHHTYGGSVLLPQSDRQQQQQQQQDSTESIDSAAAHVEEGSATPGDQPAAAGMEDPGAAFVQSSSAEQPPASSSDHAHDPDECFDMIDVDGSLFADVPDFVIHGYFTSDDFDFLAS